MRELEQPIQASQSATLADVLITDELASRVPRPPDHRAENEALHALAAQMAEHPEGLLQNLAATALTLGRAGTAGISLLETGTQGEDTLRWAAMSGAHAAYTGCTTAFRASPCGTCLERQSPQLYKYPGRYYRCLDAEPPITEALILPLPDGSRYRGTIWIMSHDEHTFDGEDVRVMTALAGFTIAAVRHGDALKNRQTALARQAREARLTAELKSLGELHQLTNRLLTAPDLQSALDELLDATLALHDTSMGTLQVYSDAEEGLTPLAHRGFEAVSESIPAVIRDNTGSSCGQSLHARKRVIVEDYETDPASREHRALAKSLGYRAAQSTPLLTREGEFLGMLTTHFREPHRPSEHALRMTDLYARQAAQLIELHRAAAFLREADRRKNEFLAVLAHELRDPLAPINNTLQVLRREDVDHHAIRSMSDVLERQVKQMVRLVDDLLDVSRISQGKIELRRERVDLAAIIQQAAETAHPPCRTKGIELKLTPSAQSIIINGDAARLTQVIGNLLNNACKFTDEGGHIELLVETDQDQAVIRVRDTGIGIDTELFPRIFEMFGQVDTARERSHGGLGIGLTLARELVELHDGTLTVHSAGPGQGSEFVVRLPVDPEPQPPQMEPAGDLAAAGHRILVVDDNPDSIDSLALLLEIIGHEVHTAQDGVEAVEAAEAFQPDLILLDIGLPRMNGHEACRRIRGESWGQPMVIAALTGWGGDDDRRRSAEAGFDTHLVKPVDDAALMELLDGLSVTGETEPLQ